jgi:hypothetical protein
MSSPPRDDKLRLLGIFGFLGPPGSTGIIAVPGIFHSTVFPFTARFLLRWWLLPTTRFFTLNNVGIIS